MPDKKFANMHYPGMKSDPEEGKHRIDPVAREKLAIQIIHFGEDGLRRLLDTAVLIVGLEPFAIELAQKLALSGIGRIGILGGNPAPLLTWLKSEAPWVTYESFSSITLDRQLSDIVRGFHYIVDCESKHSMKDLKEVVESHQLAFIKATDQTGENASEKLAAEIIDSAWKKKTD